MATNFVEKRLVTCPSCSYQTDNESKMLEHVKFHKHEHTYGIPCMLCPQKLKNLRSYWMHKSYRCPSIIAKEKNIILDLPRHQNFDEELVTYHRSPVSLQSGYTPRKNNHIAPVCICDLKSNDYIQSNAFQDSSNRPTLQLQPLSPLSSSPSFSFFLFLLNLSSYWE